MAFQRWLPHASKHHVPIAAISLFVAATTTILIGFFAQPQRADAWVTTTGANWKSTSAYNLNPAGWVNTGATLPGNLEHSQLAIIGDYVYLFGGETGNYPSVSYTNSIYRAPASNPTSWVNVGSLPSGLVGSQLAIIGDYVYLFGGGLTSRSTNAIYRAPVSNPLSWTNTGATLPNDGLQYSHLAIIGDYVYLFGGYAAGTADVVASDAMNVIFRAPISNPLSWVNTGSTLPTKLFQSQLAVIGDYVYLFGGRPSSTSITKTIYRAPVSNPTSWTSTGASLPNNTQSSSVAVIGDYVYLFGTINSNIIQRAPLSNPTLWSTISGAALPGNLGGSPQFAVVGANVYLFGGATTDYNHPTNVIYRAPLTSIAPTCTVIAAQNPIAYAATTTLSWGSTNATTVYINNVGYVTPNASSTVIVGPLATTNYDCTAGNGTATSTAPLTLTVNPPLNCSFDGGTVAHGSSATAYQSTSVPPGHSCSEVAETRTCTNGTLSGSYTHASCSTAPSCQLSLSPTSILAGQSSTLSWTSQNTTSCTPDNFAGSGTTGNTLVSPSQATTYTMSCTGPGGTAQCTGTGDGGIGAKLSLICTPAYQCTGAGGQTLIHTNADCTQTTVATCTAPSFCFNGSPVCLWPQPSAAAGAWGLTGHLQTRPNIVPKNGVTAVYWNLNNVTNCNVTATDGTSWTGATSATSSCPLHWSSGCQSGPVTNQTIFVLSCLDLQGQPYTETATVNLLPSFQEI